MDDVLQCQRNLVDRLVARNKLASKGQLGCPRNRFYKLAMGQVLSTMRGLNSHPWGSACIWYNTIFKRCAGGEHGINLP